MTFCIIMTHIPKLHIVKSQRTNLRDFNFFAVVFLSFEYVQLQCVRIVSTNKSVYIKVLIICFDHLLTHTSSPQPPPLPSPPPPRCQSNERRRECWTYAAESEEGASNGLKRIRVTPKTRRSLHRPTWLAPSLNSIRTR
jgi:hypothetical protein